jgi:hypothetical protein
MGQVKTCRKCGAEKPVGDFPRDKRCPDGFSLWCKCCAYASQAKSREKHREKRLAKKREYYRENRESILAGFAEHHAANRDQANAGRRERRLADIDRERAKCREWAAANRERKRAMTARWTEENREHCRELMRRNYRLKPERYKAASVARQKRVRRAMPAWADREVIVAIYRLCHWVSKDTGILHHVDHDIPLKGRLVCGLHVPENLRIIPAPVNLAKSNRHAGDDPLYPAQTLHSAS